MGLKGIGKKDESEEFGMMMIHMDADWGETKKTEQKNCDIRIRQTLEQEIERGKRKEGGAIELTDA